MVRYIRAVLGILILVPLMSAVRSNQELLLDKIKLPSGFKINVYATGVRNAREMTLGSNYRITYGNSGTGH